MYSHVPHKDIATSCMYHGGPLSGKGAEKFLLPREAAAGVCHTMRYLRVCDDAGENRPTGERTAHQCCPRTRERTE